YPAGQDITNQLINPTNSVQAVTYLFKARIRDDRPGHVGNFCDQGGDTTIVIYVNPTPRLSVSVPDTVVCDSSTVTITVNDLNGNVHGGTTKVYQLTTTNPGGVLNVQPDGEYPAGQDITNQLINPTNSVQAVTYLFKARIRDDRPGHIGNFCDQGGDTTIIIYVEPTPRVTGTISNDTICNNESITYTLSSLTIPYFGQASLRFNVIVINPYPTEISGYSNQVDLTLTDVITETLNNSGDTARMIMYIITPATTNILGVQNCPGINDTIRLWINPTPRVIPLNAKPAICSAESTEITLTTPTVMTKGVITFDYTVTVSGGPGDLVGSTDTVTGMTPGQKIVLPYTNNSDSIQWVDYFITPRDTLSGCADGNINRPRVDVHAVPLQDLIISTPLLCNGGSEAVLTANLSRGAKPDSIHWNGSWSIDYGYFTSANSTNANNLRAGLFKVTVIDSLGCRAADSTWVSGAILDSYLSVVEVNGYGTTCPESTDGVLMLKENLSSTGIPPFEYWIVRNYQDYQDTVRHDTLFVLGEPYHYTSNLAPGHYQLFIYDANGCVNTSYPEVNIVAPDTIKVIFEKFEYAGGYNVSCRGYNDGSAWIKTISGGRGGYTYKWSTINGTITGPDTLNRLDNITAGTYYLTTTDLMGCTKVDSVALLDPDGMVLTGSEISLSPDGDYNISCSGGSDGFIKLTITGGSGIYTFSWTGPPSFTAATKDISGLKAGTYVCTVRDLNGCILMPMPTFTLTEPALLNISASLSSSTYGSFNINCNGGTGSIDVTVTGGSTGNYIYSWTTANGSGLINGQEDQDSLTAGTYHLVVADSNNCVAEKDITLTQPKVLDVVLTPTHITCQSSGFDNGSIDLTPKDGVGPYTFSWSNGAITEDLSGLTEGYYTVTVTDVNGCMIKDSVRINLPPSLLFTKTVSDPYGNGFNISCAGDNTGYINITTTDGLAPFVFSWQRTGGGFTASTKDISGLSAGQYILTITDANLCTATDTTDLTEPGELSIIFNISTSIAGGFNINCAGDSTGSIEVIPVNPVGSVTYLWFDGATTNPRINIPAGDYRVVIEDSNHCQADSTITLTEPDSIKLVFDVTQPWCPDMPDGEIILTVSGGVVGTDYTYLWSDNSTSRDIQNATQGLYAVTVSDLNGCLVKDSVYIEPEQGTCLIIPNAISPNGDLINDIWNIGFISLYPQIEIKIFNRWGETVWRSEKGYPQPWDGRSNGSPLPIDSYHYIIDLHNGSKPLVGNVTIVR
ncbi:MAG: gliding motility-associated C-terminal domain-containing protein, partial [Bacteroidales bacterium]|nr:gliding motility-associated C-terminal domain-containing protein [Bacteroidales bacterium]